MKGMFSRREVGFFERQGGKWRVNDKQIVAARDAG